MATTSSKPPSVIKADIRRVLDRMQVQYREIKGGFECVHAPSIDLSSVQSSQLNNTRRSHQFGHTNSIHDGASMRRSLTKKASKLSFALKGKEKEKDSVQESGSTKPDNATLSSATTETDMSKSNSSSLYNVSSNTHTIKGEAVDPESVTVDNASVNTASAQPETPIKGKHLPPIPRDFASQPQKTAPPPSAFPSSSFPTGGVDQDVFDAMGSNRLSVRFEINIVKVCFHLRIYLSRL